MKNDTPHALARIPLRWMIRECFECKTGIIFDAVMLQQIGLHVKRDEYGQPVLADVPRRIPATPPADSAEKKTTFGEFISAVGHLAWSAVSAPFKQLGAIFSTSMDVATHAKHRRQVVPARRQEITDYKLRDDIPDDYEALEEKKDALSPLFDQLRANWIWVVMEYLPMRIKKQKAIVHEIESVEGYKWMCVFFLA